MDNFEYSVQLNDRDWAEFYLASEECSLSQPTLATADDLFFGDLEEGEADGTRWVRLRAHEKTSGSPFESPDRPLPAEEVWSGSDDETDLGSVSRFLCRSRQDLPSFYSLRSQQSHISQKPLRSWHLPPGPGTAFEASEGGAENIGGSVGPETKGKVPAFQGTVLQELLPTQEEKRHWESPVTLSAVEGMESPEGARGVEFHHPQGTSSQATSADIRASSESSAVAEKLDSPEPSFSPAIPFEDPGKDPPLASREEPVPSQDWQCPPPKYPVPAQPIPLLARGRGRGSGGREEGARPLEKGRGTGPPNNLQEEELGGPRVEQGKGAPCLHHGTAPTLQKGYPAQVQGGQRLLSTPPEAKGTSGSPEADFTWPEMYDHFFGDIPLEGKTWGEAPGMDTHQEFPAVSGPEMYEYFFKDVEEPTVQRREGGPRTPETFLGSDHWSTPLDVSEEPGSNAAAYALCIPEAYEHFFAHPTRDKRSWPRNLLAVPVSEVKKVVRALKSLIRRPVDFPRSQRKRRRSQARLLLLSPTLLEKGIPGRPENLEMALLHPERPLQTVFTPRDLCVGFVAFASWAVKSSDLQAPDAWKIVLLANFGTLSAIRYFRRQVVTEGRHGA